MAVADSVQGGEQLNMGGPIAPCNSAKLHIGAGSGAAAVLAVLKTQRTQRLGRILESCQPVTTRRYWDSSW